MPNFETEKKQYFVGIEGGGTKFNCIIANHPDDVFETTRIPTTDPDETLDHIITFIKNFQNEFQIKAIGLGTFGPLDINKKSPNYGKISKTTKPGWSNFDILGKLKDKLPFPIALDTDVNAAALGEHLWGAGQNLESLVYLTIGTGIGGGVIINGKPIHGLLHPEMGHLLIPLSPQSDSPQGICPYHNNCLEGIASGPAIESIWGQSPEDLPEDHPAWILEAEYLAKGLMNIILAISPQKIILGGGVMKKPGLLELIRENILALLNDYVQHSSITNSIDTYILPPALGDFSGRYGAVALASEIYLAQGV
ncbi:MAG: ROK family protein [Chloroflexi bacterium]|jgi:fructokinase|nr:ROK family protein [Chloroflexota bacterium]MBT3669793.1 ROK family protein [Chloroflexota bacterium]MBT4003736.1 ROK family protein [Chloroflexota bacterium]MBT4304694.1 ROK family protein [Chloroflexota bacterium]MBT4534804.1 ROK family protein [Chloroflexota bacterium]